MTASPRSQVGLLAVAVLFMKTLWFSATAVLPSLEAAWDLGPNGAAWLTASVQVGFVAGALVSAFFNLPDVLRPRRLVVVSGALGAAANLWLAWGVTSLEPALALRFATGACLAGVYPPAMKIVAGHITGRGRGLAIGVLVGALTMGSATPHLVAGLLDNPALSYRSVMTVSSGLAFVGVAIVALLVRDGAHAPPAARFDARQIGKLLGNRSVLLANAGYWGHMWELYAMWTWLVTFFAASASDATTRQARILAFFAIGVAGAVGAIGGGWAADRHGRTRVTILAMLISGSCCALTPLLFGAPWIVLIVFALVWGTSAVADSAQFSTAVTELTNTAYVGTALTLQTCTGFLLTMISIWGLRWLADVEWIGWQFAFVALAPGPFLGCWAMARLRRHPDAVLMAGGRR